MGVGGALQQFLRGKRKTQSRECHPKKPNPRHVAPQTNPKQHGLPRDEILHRCAAGGAEEPPRLPRGGRMGYFERAQLRNACEKAYMKQGSSFRRRRITWSFVRH